MVVDLISLPEITDEIRHSDLHSFYSRGIFYFSSAIRCDLAATSTMISPYRSNSDQFLLDKTVVGVS